MFRSCTTFSYVSALDNIESNMHCFGKDSMCISFEVNDKTWSDVSKYLGSTFVRFSYNFGNASNKTEYDVSLSNNRRENGPVIWIPTKLVAQNIGFKISISKNDLSITLIWFTTLLNFSRNNLISSIWCTRESQHLNKRLKRWSFKDTVSFFWDKWSYQTGFGDSNTSPTHQQNILTHCFNLFQTILWLQKPVPRHITQYDKKNFLKFFEKKKLLKAFVLFSFWFSNINKIISHSFLTLLKRFCDYKNLYKDILHNAAIIYIISKIFDKTLLKLLSSLIDQNRN